MESFRKALYEFERQHGKPSKIILSEEYYSQLCSQENIVILNRDKPTTIMGREFEVGHLGQDFKFEI